MNNLLFVFFFLFFGSKQDKGYLLKNEEAIFSFDTKNGKHVMVAKEKGNLYIVYRFGTKDKIEFEYAGKSKESWSKFKYYFYLRGGGVQNEGMDLNYLYFTNDNFKYTIYDTYYSADQSRSVGIKVTNIKTKKTTDIIGVYKTRKGTLTDFRENNLVEVVEESEN